MAEPTLSQHEDIVAKEGHIKPPFIGEALPVRHPHTALIAQFQGSQPSWDGEGQLGNQMGKEQAEDAVPGANSHCPSSRALTGSSWRWLQAFCLTKGCASLVWGLCHTTAGAG